MGERRALMWRATSAAAGSSMRRGLCLLVVVVLSTDSSCVGFQHAWRAPPLGCRSGAAEPAVGRSRGAALCSVLGLRGSGIIISAGSDDLDKELSRLQGLGPGLRDGQALEAPRWRSDELHREWELPLHGERVMFTTPRTHAGKLSSVLVEAGARPVWMPTVRYMPLPETGTVESSNCVSCVASLDVALLELASFDVVAFASRNAVYGFLERMKTLYGSVESAVRIISEARVKLACLPPVASLLRDKLCSLADRIIPSDEGASDLSDVLASTGSGAAVLCVAPVFEDFEEPKPLTQTMSKLSFAGMDITRVPAYRVRAGDSKLFKQELEWLTSGQIDVLGVTSALEVQGLQHMLGAHGWDNLGVDTSLVANGREAALQAAALGLDFSVLGSQAVSGEDFVLALAQQCTDKRGLQIYLDH